MPRSRHAPDPGVNRSLQHSLRDGMAFAVMTGGGETYLAAFSLFCRATASQVALLSTLPALLGAFAHLLGAWLARRLGRRKPVITSGATLQALAWLPILAVPYLLPSNAVIALLVFYTWYFAAGNLVSPPWISLMGDMVPEQRRGRFFARRTRLTSIFSFTALVCAGLILHISHRSGDTRLGFTLIFLAACVARLVSAHHLGRMHEPHGPHMPAPAEILSGPVLRELRRSGALAFSLYFTLMQTTVAIASPFFAVYMLRDLHFSYLQFMVNTGTAVFIQFVTLNSWGRISDVFGNRLILMVTGMLVPLLPLLWAVTDNFWYLIAVQCLSGVSWAGFSLSTGNLLYELVPAARRGAYAAFHNLMAAVAVFTGAMLATLLIGITPARPTLLGNPGLSSVLINLFLVSTAARLLVAIVLLKRVRELRRPRRRISPRHFIFRVTRFNAFVGLLYEAIGALRPDQDGQNGDT